MGTKRVHLLITGDVTGVGFRLSTIYVARDLGLVGWVRNVENPPASKGYGEARVEIVAEGSRKKLENLIVWSREGPPLARVKEVKVEWEKSTREFQEFSIK